MSGCVGLKGIERGENGKFSYAYYVPKLKVNTPASPKPLFIILHPANSSGDEYVEKWAPMLSEFGNVFAPTASSDAPYGSPEFEEKFLEELRNFESKFPTDERRIILIGESNGAIYGYRFLAAHPGLLEAAVFISGALEEKVLAEIGGKSAEIKTRILIVHGTEDPSFSFERAEETGAKLKKLGLNVEFKAMNGMRHGADPFCEDEVLNWIKKQI